MLSLTRRELLVGTAMAFAGSRLGQSATRRYTESGYDFDETSAEWKDLCLGLPCFAALHWPDYSTKVVDDTINSHPVLIQLWKGFCPQFASSANMPGGTGAEVGVYHRIPGKGWSRPSGFPLALYDALRVMAGNEGLWWPFPELKAEIEWDLINPETKEVAFHAGKQTTYWRNKWMENGSYKKYQGSHATPKFSWNYVLKYTINGKTYPEW